jgi:3-keto-disaccharide hydrolase
MSLNRVATRAFVTGGALIAAGVFVIAQQPAPAPPAAPPRDPHANEVPAPKSPPRVVTAGDTAGAAPSDAIVLFDGTDLSKWEKENGSGPAGWTVAEGAMVVKPGTGGIRTKQGFGDVQLHIEWATPNPAKGTGQDRGNSGVFFQSTYEVQVLDSFQNETYWHGSAGSVYKQYAPLVNASRKPGDWQVYDIVYHAPAFNADGRVTRRATFTVFHNGVLVQDHVEVMGVTTNEGPPYYKAHADKLPLSLQDHNHLVRYRNIWVREL